MKPRLVNLGKNQKGELLTVLDFGNGTFELGEKVFSLVPKPDRCTVYLPICAEIVSMEEDLIVGSLYKIIDNINFYASAYEYSYLSSDPVAAAAMLMNKMWGVGGVLIDEQNVV